MSDTKTETLLERCANQAARAVTQEIERHTGEPITLYMSMRIVNCIGAALEKPWHEGGQLPGELRAILEESYKPDAVNTQGQGRRASGAASVADDSRRSL